MYVLEIIKAFYYIAKEYCGYVYENEISNDSVSYLMTLLMKLYISALDLPELEPETADISSHSEKHLMVRINSKLKPFYWEVFEPGNCDEPVCGHLADDLSDIASDIRDGILE